MWEYVGRGVCLQMMFMVRYNAYGCCVCGQAVRRQGEELAVHERSLINNAPRVFISNRWR